MLNGTMIVRVQLDMAWMLKYAQVGRSIISGGTEAIEAVLDELSQRGIAGRRLTVSHAFHSALMDPVLDRLEALAGRIDYSPPRIGLVSKGTSPC